MAIEHDPFDLAGQQRAREERAHAHEIERIDEGHDIKWLMSSKRGRRIVWRQLGYCGVFRTSYSSDALAMAYAEGSRNIGLRLLAMIMETSPGHYLKMIEEKGDDRTSRGSAGNPVQ